MKKKSSAQLDLFEWADNRPTAQVIEFGPYFFADIAANQEWYASDEYMNRPLPDKSEVIPLRRQM